MRKNFEPQQFDFGKALEGLSEKLLENHLKLYEGYVKKTNEIQTKLESADKSEANGVYSLFGELKRQETFAVNGMKLHEVYFGGLNASPQAPSAELSSMIEADFGSLDAWKLDVVATALSARGWAILAFDYKDNSLHNYAADTHNLGAVWGAIPLLALDVYEHAYIIDYGVDRKSYLETFFKNLDWGFVNNVIEKYELGSRHGK